MKKNYIVIIVLSISIGAFSQGYEFGVVHNSSYNFSVVAIPNFSTTVTTDVSDIGFAVKLPAGNFDIIDLNQFNSRTWTITEISELTLTNMGLGDGASDIFVFNLDPNQSLLDHETNDFIELVNFNISNNPTSGEIEILSNTNSIIVALEGNLYNFFNSNIDNTLTKDYYLGLVTGLESHSFSTLNINNEKFDKNQIIIYPNTTKHFFNIVSNSAINLVELFDNTGKKILSINQTNKIDVTNLASGIYFLNINFDNININRKIIIE